MKTLRWSHSQILSDFSNCENLRDLIDAIEENGRNTSMFVCSIKVNGMSLEEEDESRFATTSITTVKEIEVEVGSIREIVEGILVNYVNWIPYLREIAEDTSQALRAGEMNIAQRSINEMADALTDLVNSLVELKRTKNSLPLSQIENVEKLEVTFLGVVKELTAAFEGGDYVLAADIVEYDLNNLLDELKSWVESCQKELALGAGKDEPIAGSGEAVP